MSTKNPIIDYYDTCESDYRLFWDLDHSLAMHAGFWDDTTKSLREALARENEIMAEAVRIHSSDHVLDAGCGIGGSCIFLAQHYGCRATGITLSAKQVETATAAALKSNVEQNVTFQVADFCHTPFPDESFDVIWGLESICHARDKNKFVKEAYRLLKKGGRLVVADGFACHSSYSEQDKNSMDSWLNKWGVESLETVSTFEMYLKENKFRNVIFKDITQHVMPSSQRLYRISFPAYLFSKAGEFLGIRHKSQTNNVLGAYYQHITLKNKLWVYALFSAVK